MCWRKFWRGVLLVGALGWLWGPSVSVAHAMPIVHQRSSGLIATRTRLLNDYRVKTWSQPRHYRHAKHLHNLNVIKRAQGRAVTFKTAYLLPNPGYRHQAWGNPQGMALVGRYLYVVYCPTAWKNRGRIVRFDRTKLAALKATPRQLQRAYTKAAKHSHQEAAIRRAIKVGPAFITGHGQSLAYNWKDHHLYMWCDRESAPRVPTNQYGYINRISARSLRPNHQIRFRLRSRHLAVPGGHVLAFDKQGRAYFWTRPSAHRVNLYQGKITLHHVSFRLTHQVLRHSPGPRVQNIGYNPRNGRLYLVSDDSVASLPVKSLRGHGHLTGKRVRWTGFTPRREFEALAFTPNGRAYLMSNHNPEILKSTGTKW